MFSSWLRRWWHARKSLEASHQEADNLKAQTNQALTSAVNESVERSGAASRKFSKISSEVETMADDIATRIARATGKRNHVSV